MCYFHIDKEVLKSKEKNFTEGITLIQLSENYIESNKVYQL